MSNRRDRRSVLRAGLACCSLGLAGCLDLVGEGGEDGNEAGGGSSDGTEPPNRTAPDPNGTDGNGTDTDGNSTDPDDDEPPEPDPEPVTSWPMQQYDAQNTGAVPAPSPAEVELDWQYETDSGIRSSPVVADDVVYIGDKGGAVYAIGTDRETHWKKSVSGDKIDATPAIYDDLVIVPFQTHLQAYDRVDGTEQWQYPSEYGVGELTVADGAVFFGDTTSRVHAVDASTGDERWTMPSGVYGSSYTDPPAVLDGEVVIPRSRGAENESREISAIGIEDGRRRPLVRTTEYDFQTGISVSNGRLYIGASDGVYSFDSSGTEKARFSTERPIESGLAVANETVLAMSTKENTGTLYGLDRSLENDQWSVQTNNSVNTGPIVCGSYVLWGHYGPEIDSTLKAVDLGSGETAWSMTLDEISGFHQWAASGHRLFAAGSRGFVVSLQVQ